MLKLIILRHAKSSWSEPGQSDFERALNSRGMADLPKIANALEKRGHVPDTIYCSPAKRTKLTMEGILIHWNQKPSIHFDRDMYIGGTSAYLAAIRQHKSNDVLMLVGHNPTCHSLVVSLAGHGEAGALSAVATKYPTGTASILQFDVENWLEVSPGNGHLIDFLMPKQL